MVLWQYPKCLFTICLCSLYRQHLFEQNTNYYFISIFLYKVIFAQIFIKGAFLFSGVLSSDNYYWISWKPEHLSSEKAATKEGSHYKNVSLWCQNIGENGQAPPRKTFKLHTLSCCKNFSTKPFFVHFMSTDHSHVLASNECISHGNLHLFCEEYTRLFHDWYNIFQNVRGLIEIFPDQIICVAGQFSDSLAECRRLQPGSGLAPAANNYTNMVISNLHPSSPVCWYTEATPATSITPNNFCQKYSYLHLRSALSCNQRLDPLARCNI